MPSRRPALPNTEPASSEAPDSDGRALDFRHQHPKVGAAAINPPCLFQLADFRGHSAALHPQIVRQRLPVMGNDEFAAAMLLGLFKQEFHQLFLSGFLGYTADFLGEDQIAGNCAKEQLPSSF